jgi:hypothetical protein
MDPAWRTAVTRAKKKIGSTGYQIIKGPLLKEAQKMYCASKGNK